MQREKQMNRIVQEACDLLNKRQVFVLATIISHSGSTPRTTGSKTIVSADGRGSGTIAGPVGPLRLKQPSRPRTAA
jgi:xanthine/CO dehydrogenase XdhC/CoxF family maturation factor